jgi:hypothetical protein
VRRSGVNQLDLYTTSYGTWRAAAFTVSSDRAFKSAIRALSADEDRQLVETLLKASVYMYKRKGAGEERHLGLMADELPQHVVVEGAHPESIGDDADKHKGETTTFVDLYKLATGLLATVQSLNERLMVLEGGGAK